VALAVGARHIAPAGAVASGSSLQLAVPPVISPQKNSLGWLAWLGKQERAGLALAALAIALLLANSSIFERASNAYIDSVLSWTQPSLRLDDVVIIDIDDTSLRVLSDQLGPWPYSREVYARLIQRLRSASASAIGINMVFTDERPGDQALASELAAQGPAVVLAAAGLRQEVPNDAQQNKTQGLAFSDTASRWPSFALPAISVLATDTKQNRIGLVSTPLDNDGVLRRWPLRHQADGVVLDAFPLALLKASQPGHRAEGLYPGNSVRLMWPASIGKLQHLSFSAVANEALGLAAPGPMAQAVRGRTVIVGNSASWSDRTMTPSGQLSGSEVLAVAYAAMAQNAIAHDAPPWLNAVMVLIALCPTLFIGGPLQKRVAKHAAYGLLCAAVLVGISILAWQASLWANPLTGLLLVLIGLVLGLWQYQRQLAQENAALAQQRAMADAANQAKSEFLSSMSHELRTPLNGVIGAAQLLQDHATDPERRSELLGIIRSSGTHLLGLIDAILNLARIEAGAIELFHEDFDLLDCVESALTTAAVPARLKGVHLVCIFDRRLTSWRFGDAAHLRQVVVNLVGNAVKFTQRGQVVVHLKPGDEKETIVIEVADTGIGMNDEALQHLFEPFRQAGLGTMRRFGGSGLGLSICRKVVTLMDGHIHARSRLGQGSAFTVTLPLPNGRSAAPIAPQLDYRVVVVEPHPASAQGVTELLARLGCEAVLCNSEAQLQDALTQTDAQGRPPWVLISDDNHTVTGLLQMTSQWAEYTMHADRAIRMSASEWLPMDKERAFPRLPRSVIKPVFRSALVSRMAGGGDVARQKKREVAQAARAVAANCQVLVVEDDPVNQAIVCGMLENAGYSVTVADDGASALRLFAEARFDLILMDWQLPDTDGLAVTKQLRSGSAGQYGQVVPIVGLTANAFADDRMACLAAGMSDFLSKPVVAEDLIAAVSRWSQAKPRSDTAGSD
jgi:signal transduction histidine kinase/ActR/RegA family two-component response regulator